MPAPLLSHTRRGITRFVVATVGLGPMFCAAQADDVVAEAADCHRVGTVRIARLNVFDTRIPEEDRSLYRLVNALHVESRDSTLRQMLLFKEGDAYDPRLLQESERLLRSTGYLHDASIRTVACPGGAAEIVVDTQDVWTLKPSVSIGRKGGRTTSGIGIEDSNLLGLGTQLGLDIKSGLDRNTRTLFYRDRLVGGQRLDLSGEYANNSDGRAASVALERPFYALDTRWAAGVSLHRETRLDPAYEQGAMVGQFRTREQLHTVYGGWSSGFRDGWVSRWTTGWTYNAHVADPVITGTMNTFVTPSSQKLSYPWVGYELVEDRFQETRNLDQIGKTEDLALGWHVSTQLGASLKTLGSDRDATVFLAKITKGLQPSRQHTVLFDASATGRVEGDAMAGTLLGARARYYYRPSTAHSTYLSLSTDRAINPDPDQQVLLGGDSGLRGYPLRYQSGKGRWLLTAEQRYFTDWYPFRLFNVGGAVFYDMGRAWDHDDRTQQAQGLLRDLGFGLRLGNSRSALSSMVHIDLAFPLDGDRSIRKVQLLLETRKGF